MNIRIILAALAVSVPAAVSAEVHLYGNIRSGVAVAQTKAHGSRHITRTAVEDLGSYIGLRGSHPIGNGSNMIWQFEQDTPVGGSGSMREYFKRKKENGTARTGD